MKKILGIMAVCVLSFLFAFSTKAEVPDGVYFFGDGNGYSPAGEHTHFCLQDRNCYTVDGKFAFQREVQGAETTIPAPTTTTTYIPYYVTPNTGNVPTPPTAGSQAPAFSPFSGAPYVLSHRYEQEYNHDTFIFGINLKKENKNGYNNTTNTFSQDQSKVICSINSFPAKPGATNYQLDFNKRSGEVNSDYGYGHHSCQFVITVPEGTFTSEAIEFDLVQPE